MKSAFVFCAALIAVVFLQGCQTGARSIGVQPGVTTDGLQMSLVLVPSSAAHDPEFEIAIRNVGETDVCLNLGYMLANGKRMFPQNINLVLIDKTGKTWTLSVGIVHIAGRVDDYMVPLRVGSAYSIRLRLGQLVSPKTGEFQIKLPRDGCAITAEFAGISADRVNRDMEGMRLMNFWNGRLRSNTIRISRAEMVQ